ncbi:MAG: sulfatase-like hydrolase/transferase [Verrucomicrobiales bacterium]|nr:sulfatase-like hydrolase/transferase [Verrucomicrobiales bacterium]
MTKIHCLLTILLGFATALQADSPNIILILTDDQGWSQRSGLMDPENPKTGSSYLHTPAMDRIADEGMRFTGGYSPAPLCTPTRRSILCGTSAARSGSEFESKWVPADHLTLPRALKQANPEYQCAHFGKWGEKMISSPEECGYDVSDGHTGNVTGGMADKMQPAHIVEDPKRTGSVTNRSIEFIREQTKAGKPFYAQVSYYAVHLRTELLQASLEKYENKGAPDRAYSQGWAGMLEELDRGIGRILDELDALGISDETYVIFTTDNGGRGTVPGGNPKSPAPNVPLSGAKHSLLEGGIRVPLLVRGPSIEAGSVCRVPVAGYDFLPTFFELAGGEGDLSDELDGGSFISLFTDPETDTVKRPIEGLIFSRPRQGMAAIRDGEWKLLAKVNAERKIQSAQLFNVVEDIAEERNQTATQPDMAKQMRKRLQSFLDNIVDPSPTLKRRKKGA